MIILASKSPRRIELLKDAGIQFSVCPSEVAEIYEKKLKPIEVAKYLSSIKADDVFSRNKDAIVIGADTIVVYKNEILGKPKSSEDGFKMLSKLSGKKHYVYTGVTIISAEKKEQFVISSSVYMKKLSPTMIRVYLESDEPYDKAGAYAIQGQGSKLIRKYEGDYFSIMGLPIKKVIEILKTFESNSA